MQSPCPFYEHLHVGETWEVIDEAIMACRHRQTEVGDSLPDEQRTQTTEMIVADSGTLIVPCLYWSVVTVLGGGMCEKCADEGKWRVY